MGNASQSHTGTAIALVTSEHSQLLPQALNFMLQGNIPSHHVVELLILGLELSHLVLQSLDVFFRPLTNGSLCLSIVGALSRQLFSGKSCHFTSSRAGFSLLCRRLRGVLVRAHRDVLNFTAYNELFATRLI
jgi:hypothetical protein